MKDISKNLDLVLKNLTTNIDEVNANLDEVSTKVDAKQDAITSSNKLAYGLISGTPEIPEKTSQLLNDSPIVVVEDKTLLSTAYTVDFTGAPIQKFDFGSGAEGSIEFNYENLSGVADKRVSTVEVQIPVNSTVSSITFPAGTQTIEIPDNLDGANAGEYAYHDIVFRKQGNGVYANYAYKFDEDVDYFWVQRLASGEGSIYLNGVNRDIGYISLEYSTDKVNWTLWDGSAITMNQYDKIYFRAEDINDEWGSGWGTYIQIADSDGSNGNLKVGGNIMTLVDGSGKLNEIPVGDGSTSQQYYFSNIFNLSSGVTDASELILPIMKFNTNTSLAMLFYNNSRLIAAPKELPNVYAQPNFMYAMMFQGCASLTKAPVINTTKLDSSVNNSLSQMFQGCASLNEIEVHFTNWGKDNGQSTVNWVNGVAPSGTFKCPASLPIIRDVNHIPAGWTIVNI